MKTIVCGLILAVFSIVLASPWVSTAQTPARTANGSYRFVLDDDLTKYVEFDAHSDERGTTTGRMIFRDEARIPDQDVDGVGSEPPREEPPEFFMQAQLDTLTIEHNRAIMSGAIVESSRPGYVGKWVQLVVEDNGDGQERPDRFSWRFCAVEEDGWTPSDYEDPRDEGAWWHWWATDFEQREDPGIPSRNIIPDRTRRCEALPLSSFSFDDVNRGEGQIVVQP